MELTHEEAHRASYDQQKKVVNGIDPNYYTGKEDGEWLSRQIWGHNENYYNLMGALGEIPYPNFEITVLKYAVEFHKRELKVPIRFYEKIF